MAAPSIVQSTQSTAGTGTTARQCTLSVTSGNLLLFFAAAPNANSIPIPSVSDTASNTWTSQASLSLAGLYHPIRVWSAVANSTTSLTVTFSDTGLDANEYWCALVELSGYDASPIDGAGTDSTSWGISLTVTSLPNTTYAEDIVFGFFSNFTTNAFTVGSGFTSLQAHSTGGESRQLLEYRTTSSTGSYDPSASKTGNSGIVGAALSIKGSAWAATTSLPIRPIQFSHLLVR